MRALVVALLVLCTSVTYAQDADEKAGHTYRAVIDRVDLEPSALTGLRLRVYLSALTIGGKLLDLTESKSIKVYLGSSELKQPFALGTFDGTHGDLAIVVLVQATLDYQDTLAMIGDSLDRDLMAALPDGAQMVIVPYGETVGTDKLSTAKALKGKVALATDNYVGEPVLLDAIDRALILMKKAKATPESRPLRKMIVVIGDGRDQAGDRERVTRTAQRAAKESVRIHSIAFSAADVRKPMLTLGELSKHSLGTFRWVRSATAESWQHAFVQLRDEIQKQYVLTYFVSPDDDVANKKLKVVTVGRTEVTSLNEVKVPPSTCGGAECTTGYCGNDTCLQYREGGGRGVLGWVLLVGGILLGLIVILWVIGFLMGRSQQQVQSPQSQPPKKQNKQKGVPAVPPGFLPNGRPIPGLLVMSGPLAGQGACSS